ncbi:hypothetical protein AACH06_17025 [Ideonella sp. DXS29W]|uniref:Linalool dehydratase/isomerase domain-containing protein n=1 Tax=Ideonella lacteola TaxID=2984193 RepID=A0ABU9BRD8_9BURK
MNRDLSREAHLWYVITSPAYVTHARDKLNEALTALRDGIANNPILADYRPIPFWGTVIEGLLASFDNARAILARGEHEPMLKWVSQLSDVPRGFRESNLGWLSPEGEKAFMKLLNDAYGIAGKFSKALAMSQMYSTNRYKEGAGDWRAEIPEDLGIVSNTIMTNHEASVYNVMGWPNEIPEYAPDHTLTCVTGKDVPWTGVWVPANGPGTAALAFARQGQLMQAAYEPEREFAPSEYVEANKLVETAWNAVKATGDTLTLLRVDQPNAAGEPSFRLATGRCEAGSTCPKEGFWRTPAKGGTRRHFAYGETMPSVGGDWGTTIWQWDRLQGGTS